MCVGRRLASLTSGDDTSLRRITSDDTSPARALGFIVGVLCAGGFRCNRPALGAAAGRRTQVVPARRTAAGGTSVATAYALNDQRGQLRRRENERQHGDVP